MIYRMIWLSQVVCLLISAGSLYLACSIKTEKRERAPIQTALAGILIAQWGGLLFLQGTVLRELQSQRGVLRTGVLIAVTAGLIGGCRVFYEKRILIVENMLIGISTAFAVLINVGSFAGLWAIHPSIKQNQIFYYIEETPSYLQTGFVGYLMICVAAAVLFGTIGYAKRSRAGGIMWAAACIVPVIGHLLSGMEKARHLNLMLPAMAVTAVFLLWILAVWKTEV